MHTYLRLPFDKMQREDPFLHEVAPRAGFFVCFTRQSIFCKNSPLFFWVMRKIHQEKIKEGCNDDGFITVS